jgi:hypothetical protein
MARWVFCPAQFRALDLLSEALVDILHCLIGCACRFSQLADAKVSESNFGQNIGNSVDISKAFFEMVIWKFESSQVSQPVRRLENVSLLLAERPANGGFLRISISL